MSSVSSFSICRSTRSPAGSPDTTSVMSRAGTVMAPSISILPGTQTVMPISRFVAVRRSPPSWVRMRTLDRTGSVARLLTARLTTDRPLARFSCIKDSFTSGALPAGRTCVNLIFSSRHHHHAVDCADNASVLPRTAHAGTSLAMGGERRCASCSQPAIGSGRAHPVPTAAARSRDGCPRRGDAPLSTMTGGYPPAPHIPGSGQAPRSRSRWPLERRPAHVAAPRCAPPPGRSCDRHAGPWNGPARRAPRRCAGARHRSPRA